MASIMVPNDRTIGSLCGQRDGIDEMEEGHCSFMKEDQVFQAGNTQYWNARTYISAARASRQK
jgi:hypothetical protein